VTTRPPPDADDPLLTSKEVVAYTRKSLRTFRRWTAGGAFPVLRLGRSVLVRKSALEAFLRRCESKPQREKRGK
jgi:excisionase family DNA binding protein